MALCRYDPPWTLPWLRRNEVAIPVTAPLPVEQQPQADKA